MFFFPAGALHPPDFLLILFLECIIIPSYQSGLDTAEMTAKGFQRGRPDPAGERVRAPHFFTQKQLAWEPKTC